MKKFLTFALIFAFSLGLFSSQTVFAKTAHHTTKHSKKSSVAHTTMKWAPGALAQVNNLRSFDYNAGIRDAFVRKIEKYAKRKHIKLITAAVINGMRE